MRAVICTAGDLQVAEIAAPRPGPGQILLNVSRCGICGSDLHARVHLDDHAVLAKALGQAFPTSDQKLVLGHEFCGEVVEYGPDTNRRWPRGTLVAAMPRLRDGRRSHILGMSADATGGYAEQVVVQESLTLPVPNGLTPDHAALTEPLAVGWHAVQRSRIKKHQTAYVIGCGPVGLAVVAMLKAAGVRTIVASDLSPRRRDLARTCGADVVVDAGDADPFDTAAAPHRLSSVPELLNLTTPGLMELGFDTMARLRRVAKVPWWYVFRAAHAVDRGSAGPVIFECVGVPGIIDRLLTSAPPKSRIIVVGACQQADTFHPIVGIHKEVDISFSTGWNPGEFRDTLHMVADGKVDAAPFITGTVGLDGVSAAFDALGNPERHAKILIDPASAVNRLDP